MTLKNVTIVGGKEFAHPFYDQMLAFIIEENETSTKMAGGKPNHNGVEVVRDEISEVIGGPAYINIEMHKTIEPFAVTFLPEKYPDLSIVTKSFEDYDARGKDKTTKESFKPDDDEDPMAFLEAMLGGRGRKGQSVYPPEMKADIEALELTIVDVNVFPISGDIFFKVVRNDNPEVTAWIDSSSVMKKRK